MLNIERIPGMKAKVFNKLSTAEQGWEDMKGYQGITAGREARRRLNELKGSMEDNQEKKLEEMIQQTAQKSALQAINLERLLKKKWSEEKDSYFILSKIGNDKQSRRLNDLCFNRYIL